jgi:hypothetical protein
MLKTTLSLAVLASALAFAGCSSVSTKVDSGPIHAKTFAFIARGSREVPGYADKRDQIHAAVQDAIAKNLTAKGLQKTTDNADIVVAYLLIAGNNATTTSLNDYFGYTAEAAALVEKVHKEQTIRDHDRGYFEAGTLVIDLLDSKTSKVLKRTTVQEDILRSLPLDQREARLQAAVDQALSTLRIAK